MRLLFATLTTLCFALTSAQTVLGIKFGTEYKKVKEALQERFGKYDVHENGGSLELYTLTMGNFEFDYGTFGFQYGISSFFNYAEFQKHYYLTDVTAAKSNRDYLFSMIKDKYGSDTMEFTNSQNFRCYRFGTNPVDSTKYLGSLVLQRSRGKDNKERLYIILTYGPIQYLKYNSDF